MKEQILKYFFLSLLYIFSFNSMIYSQWTLQNNGLKFWHWGNAIDACDSNTAVIAVDSTLFETEDGGNNWQKVINPLVGNGELSDVSIIDKSHFWIATYNGAILATSNGGNNWTVQFYDTSKTRFMDYVKMFDLNNGVAIGDAVGNNPFLFLTTTNGGKDWISANYNDFQGGLSEDTWRPISFVSPSIGYFNMSRGEPPYQLLKTIDGGKSWLMDTNYSNSGILIKFHNESLGLVVSVQLLLPGLNFAFTRTIDGGNNWETFNLPSNDFPAYASDLEFVPGHPSELWFVDLVNLYFSSDTGRTWAEQKIYSNNLNGSEIVFSDSTHGWLLCDSGKVFHTSNNGGIITAVSPAISNTPSEYLLKQNYPNPFNPSTTIHYEIPFNGFVTLKVYDILGNVVKTLVNQYQAKAKYDINFNADNLASGIYLYRLRAGSFILTKKMLLLK